MADDVKDRLMATALKLFVERGYAATTVREIVEGANVSKPALYYHFKNKEGIYLEIMSGILSQFEKQLISLSDKSGSATDRIVAFLSTLILSAKDSIDAVRLAYSIYFGPPQGAPFIDFDQLFDKVFSIVERLIREGIEKGEIAACDPLLKSWCIISVYNTTIEEHICRKEPRIDIDSFIKIIKMELEHGSNYAG